MSEECKMHNQKLPCRECEAEQQKKQEYYEPNQVCAYCGETEDCVCSDADEYDGEEYDYY